MLYPGNENDCYDHYDLTKDCVWSFNRLMSEDPVFVFSSYYSETTKKQGRIQSNRLTILINLYTILK
jgi:hypothetical protein